jgi:peptidoglycan/LPS O-acetylase OafA/YrhL
MDGFRGLAVLCIVLGHVRWRLGTSPPVDVPPLKYIYTASFFGVDLLFVVSGFVLFLPAVLNEGSLGAAKTFLVRRAARIVPAFWAAMIFSYAIAWKVGELEGRGTIGAWLSHMFFMSAYAHPREDAGFGVNSPIWTMSVEVIFYFCLLLVARWYYRRPFLGLGIAMTITELWHNATLHLTGVIDWLNIGWTREAVTQAQYRMAHAFPGFATQFAVGMTAAWIFARVRTQPSTPELDRVFPAVAMSSGLGIIALAALGSWKVAHGLEGPFDHWTDTLERSLLFGALVCATALAPRVVQWPVANDATRFMGTVCYGMYLCHLPLIYLLIPALGLKEFEGTTTDAVMLTAVVVPLSLAIGVVSYTFLEQPFRRLARRKRAQDSLRPAESTHPMRPVALSSTGA